MLKSLNIEYLMYTHYLQQERQIGDEISARPLSGRHHRRPDFSPPPSRAASLPANGNHANRHGNQGDTHVYYMQPPGGAHGRCFVNIG